jgi:hypothetical protein
MLHAGQSLSNWQAAGAMHAFWHGPPGATKHVSPDPQSASLVHAGTRAVHAPLSQAKHEGHCASEVHTVATQLLRQATPGTTLHVWPVAHWLLLAHAIAAALHAPASQAKHVGQSLSILQGFATQAFWQGLSLVAQTWPPAQSLSAKHAGWQETHVPPH